MARSQRPADDPREIIPGPSFLPMAVVFIVAGYLFHFALKYGEPDTSPALMALFVLAIVYAICWLQTLAHRRRLTAIYAARPAMTAYRGDIAQAVPLLSPPPPEESRARFIAKWLTVGRPKGTQPPKWVNRLAIPVMFILIWIAMAYYSPDDDIQTRAVVSAGGALLIFGITRLTDSRR